MTLILTAAAQNGSSQRKTKREARQQKREIRYDSTMTAAIVGGNFTFTPEYIGQNGEEGYPFYVSNNVFYITPGELRVLITYISPSQPSAITPGSIDFLTADYTYKSQILKNGFYSVQVTAKNIKSSQPFATSRNQNYTFSFEISPQTGRTYLTISSKYNSPIIYTGVVTANP